MDDVVWMTLYVSVYRCLYYDTLYMMIHIKNKWFHIAVVMVIVKNLLRLRGKNIFLVS